MLALPLGALERDELAFEFQEARSYFQAQQYDEALIRYEKLLKLPLSRSERDRVLFNIGTTCLAVGRWDEAMAHFSQVMEDGKTSPLLLRRLKTNQAVAMLRKAQSLLGEEMGGLFEECAHYLQEALRHDKAMTSMEGANWQVPTDLQEMQRELLIARALHEKIQREKRLEEAPTDELIKMLMRHTTQRARTLEMMSGKALKALLPGLASVDREQLGEWEALRKKISDEEQMRALVSAESGYLSGVDLMREERGWKARSYFGESLIHLKVLEGMLEQSDLLKELLSMRSATRQRKELKRVGKELGEVLAQEDKQLSRLAQEVAHRTGQKSEDMVVQEVFRVLTKRLQEVGGPEDALYDLALYRVALIDEKNSLEELWRTLRVIDPRGLPFAVLSGRAIHEKLKIRADLEPAKKVSVAALAMQRFEKEKPQVSELLVAVEEAVFALDPRLVLRWRTEDAMRVASEAVQRRDFDDAMAARLRKQLEVIEKTGEELKQESWYELFSSRIQPVTLSAQHSSAFHFTNSLIWLGRARQALIDEELKVDRFLKSLVQEQTLSLNLAEIQQESVFQEIAHSQDYVVTETHKADTVIENMQEVLKLVAEGREHARAATEQFLAEDDGIPAQRSALEAFEKALEALQSEEQQESPEGNGEGDGEGDGAGGEAPEQPDPAPQSGAAADGNDADDLLEQLMEMEREDRIQDQQKPPPREGFRPW